MLHFHINPLLAINYELNYADTQIQNKNAIPWYVIISYVFEAMNDIRRFLNYDLEL